jgi:multidrug efflux pump subunit AcrA (membrane-fusion protein)
VLEHDLPYVRNGGRAVVTPSSSPDARYVGRIVAVLPVVDTATRAGRVLVSVRTGDGRLRPGMYADVDLEAARLPGRVLVPAGAVIERDGRTLVFRARSGRADWVYVPVGRSNGVETEILPDSVSGRTPVSPGDTVLIGGHLTLTHDAPIRVRLQEPESHP